MTRKTNAPHPRTVERRSRHRAASPRKTVGYDRIQGEEQWLTPRYITDALGRFDFDPCSPIERPWPTARQHWTKADDGLAQYWEREKIGWVNPPYGSECTRWMKRAAEHGNNLLLIFSRTDTRAFHRHVWEHPSTTAVFFFEGRLRFHHVDGRQGGSAGAASVIVAYGETARDRLVAAVARGELKGRVVLLNEGQADVYRLGRAPLESCAQAPNRPTDTVRAVAARGGAR